MEKFLSGKHILITGGTSRLGSAVVETLLQGGATVSFTYFKNKAAAQELIRKGAHGFCLDLSTTAVIDAFVKEFKSSAGARPSAGEAGSPRPVTGRGTPPLQILIHNAAAVRDHTIQNMTDAEWDEVLDVGLRAPYYLTKKLLPLLLKRKRKPSELSSPHVLGGDLSVAEAPDKDVRGRHKETLLRDEGRGSAKIFFITSRAALKGAFGAANYAAAKAGLIGLAKSLAQELGPRKVLVNALNPGFMKSSMTAPLSEAVIQSNLDANPLGEWSEPGQVAGFLAYLCSDAVRQVTGQVFHFEGRNVI